MGDIFCLIILESGSRRKLKLREGTYDELLASLRCLADVVLDNTLIQVFDTDLEDFVDLLPDDTIENKAKLRIIQKNTPKRAASAACSNGFVTPNQPQHNGWGASSVQRPLPPWHGHQSADTAPQRPSFAAGSMLCQQQQRPTLPEEATSADESALVDGSINSIKLDLMDDIALADDAEAICRISEVFSQAVPEQHENDDADHSAKSSDKTVSNGDMNNEETESQPQQHGARARSDAENGDKESEDPVVRMSEVQKMLKLLASGRPLGNAANLAAKSGGSQGKKRARQPAPLWPSRAAELIANPGDLSFERDKRDHFKFKLPSSFGSLCDAALARKDPVTKNIKRMVIEALFSQCMKVTMYPSRKLYYKAIDVLMTAHPHLLKGLEWDAWVRALRCKFKNIRRRLPEGMVPPKYQRQKLGPRKKKPQQVSDDSEHSDASNSSKDTTPARNTDSTFTLEQYFATDAAASLDDAQARPSSPTDSSGVQGGLQEEVMNSLSTSATPLKEVTVLDLLEMCTREPITPKKLLKQSTLEWHDDEETGSQLQQIGEEQSSSTCRDPTDYLRFELPSLGIYEDCVAKKAVLTGRMRRYIVNCLFKACYNITMYPSSRLYRTAVESLIEKYPHLKDTTGETGREIWTESLRFKFKNIRRTLPGHMWGPEAAESQPPGDKPSAKRRKSDDTCWPDDVKRVTRVAVKTDQLSPDQLPNKAELIAAQKRHESVRAMSVGMAVMAFPSWKHEPSLLAEFRTLWRRDIAECFEKGIKRMFLVLMNSGSVDEIAAFSQADSDILMVVLNATAARCGELLDSLLTVNVPHPTPCLVKRADGSLELFVAGYFLFTASSLLGAVCALFSTFWLFHIEYPKNARSVLTFLEHAFLDLRQTKPRVRCYELINLYRTSSV